MNTPSEQYADLDASPLKEDKEISLSTGERYNFRELLGFICEKKKFLNPKTHEPFAKVDIEHIISTAKARQVIISRNALNEYQVQKSAEPDIQRLSEWALQKFIQHDRAPNELLNLYGLQVNALGVLRQMESHYSSDEDNDNNPTAAKMT
jgi:hypothetical protein